MEALALAWHDVGTNSANAHETTRLSHLWAQLRED